MFMKLFASVILSSCLFSAMSPLEAFSVSLGFDVQRPVRPIVVNQTVPVVQEVYYQQSVPVYQQTVPVWGATPVYTGSRAPVYTQVSSMPVYSTNAPVYNSAPIYTGPVMQTQSVMHTQSVVQAPVVTQTQFVGFNNRRAGKHHKHRSHHRSHVNSVDVQFLLGGSR